MVCQSRRGPGISQNKVVCCLETSHDRFNPVHRPSIARQLRDDVVQVAPSGEFAENCLLIVEWLDWLPRCLHGVSIPSFVEAATPSYARPAVNLVRSPALRVELAVGHMLSLASFQ